jgi:1,2-diacylglycerol 3-alpha-glucosyltransferase
MFSDTYFPYISGVVRSIERLAAALRERGHEVTIFGPSYWGHKDEAGACIRRCPALPLYPPANIVLSLPSLTATIKALKEQQIEIVHVHSPFVMGITGVKAARRLGIPVVFTHHSVYHEYAVYAPKPLRARAESLILHWLDDFVHMVDGVIAPSCSTQSFVLSAYGIQATVISNPIAAIAGTGEQRIRSEEPLLVFVGRLGKEKNLPLLIRAFALVHQKRAARLVLVGDGPERAALERLAGELGVVTDMTITGFVSYQEVCRWYREATLFTFPSTNETQGMVILEALAHGVPVVAAESEVSCTVAASCPAVLAVPVTAEDMAEAILRTLAHAQLHVLGEEGRRFAQSFTATQVAQQMEEYYDKVIAMRVCGTAGRVADIHAHRAT